MRLLYVSLLFVGLTACGNNNTSNQQSTLQKPLEKACQAVECVHFQIHWPHGNINHYLENMIQKYLRKQPGVIATLFPGIGKDALKIDYDPVLISQQEIITILECFQLEVVQI